MFKKRLQAYKGVLKKSFTDKAIFTAGLGVVIASAVMFNPIAFIGGTVVLFLFLENGAIQIKNDSKVEELREQLDVLMQRSLERSKALEKSRPPQPK